MPRANSFVTNNVGAFARASRTVRRAFRLGLWAGWPALGRPLRLLTGPTPHTPGKAHTTGQALRQYSKNPRHQEHLYHSVHSISWVYQTVHSSHA